MGEKENGHQNPSSPAAVTADAGSATSASPPPLELQLPITAAAAASKNPKKLTLLPLIFFIYFEVAGGPSGAEPAVKAAGPLLANLGFLIFPFIWSVPEALITAELSTAFPGNGGYVIWAHRAFGPFWGSAMGLTKFSASVINMASFPALAVDYLRRLFPIFSGGAPRTLALLLSTLAMSLLNYSGLSVVGYASIILGCVSLCPFILMPVIAIPKIRPHRWLRGSDKKTDWNLFFNTLFWNLNFWDNVSTVAGEVDNARKIIPRALFASVLFICATYLIPLLAITGSVAVPQEEWTDGFFADAAEMVAGKWLKIWIEIGAVLSAVGLYEAQLSSCAYGMLGMADLGFLPRFFASRAAFFGTPWVGILLSTAIAIAASFMGFSDIIRSANFVYSLGMLLEFASFVWLRRKSPEIKRPYRVPLGTAALAVMCLVPSGLLAYIMATATKVVYLVSGVMMVVVAGLYFLIKLCKSRGWLRFSNSGGEIGDEG